MDTKVGMSNDPTEPQSEDLSKLDNDQLFDKLIDDINGWGWFQKRMWILSLIVSITAACNHLSPLFTAYSPSHLCISSGKLHKMEKVDLEIKRYDFFLKKLIIL